MTIIEIDGIRIHAKYGCGTLRASNTQPMLSLRIESDSKENLNKIKEEFLLLNVTILWKRMVEKATRILIDKKK